ncbi:MAG: RNA polymerase sigma-70 factor [Muribaculaceae bacterium]|nr:RNA polymerase sigma-70 factor [Muribaculaceae bacterium]
MAKDRTYSDDMLLAALRLDSHEAFLRIFRLYYTDLVLFCGRYIADPHACEDIVQDVFVKIWEERLRIDIRGSLRSYLAALVHNRAIDELRRHKVKDRYISSLQLQILSLTPEEHLFYTDLDQALARAIARLSPPLRETLALSIERHLSYPQIASALGLSVRAVEARMAKALAFIRYNLKNYKFCLLITVFSDCINNLTGPWT